MEMMFRPCVYSIFISLVLSGELVTDTSSVSTRNAFVTMLYHNHLLKDVEFELGIRVLGQSLRESKTVNEYVVLCLDDVPESTRRVLESDGWTVKSVDRLFASSTHYNRYTTIMNLWLLEEYRRIVWLETDTIVLFNLDELFKCGDFCAVYRHSDQFNTEIIVVKPSKNEFGSIMKTFVDVNKKPHYRSGDQYVLNKHYENLKYTTLFNGSDKVYHENPMRLPSGYNKDASLYYVNDNYWGIPSSEVKIIHYTVDFLKPTKWWSYLLFDLNWKWNELRERLPSSHNEPSVWDLYNWIPLVVTISTFILLRCFGHVFRQRLQKHMSKLSRFVDHLAPGGWIATCFPLFAELFSLYVAFLNVPTIMPPREAWFVYGMWVTLILLMTYIPYCYFLHLLGRLKMNLATKIEICMYLLLYVLIYVLLIYIPLKIVFFFQRLLAIIIIGGTWFVCGYLSGCRILKMCYQFTNLESEP